MPVTYKVGDGFNMPKYIELVWDSICYLSQVRLTLHMYEYTKLLKGKRLTEDLLKSCELRCQTIFPSRTISILTVIGRVSVECSSDSAIVLFSFPTFNSCIRNYIKILQYQPFGVSPWNGGNVARKCSINAMGRPHDDRLTRIQIHRHHLSVSWKNTIDKTRFIHTTDLVQDEVSDSIHIGDRLAHNSEPD